MVDIDKEERRKKRNRDIVERMKKGDPLSSFNPMSSFFPPRPIIAKNKKDLERVYDIKGGEKDDDNATS